MRKLVAFCFLLLPLLLSAQEPLIQNVYAREHVTLNDSWNYIIDPFDMGYYDYRLRVNPNGFFKNKKAQGKSDLVEYNFDTAPLMVLPSDWNTKDQRLYFYEGSMWFKKDFKYSRKPGKKTFVYFGAINYDTKVYLNGEKIGEHIGSFTPFNVDSISFNSYLGWYGGSIEDIKNRNWEIPYDKPFFVSEFGAGALQGKHGDN